MTNLVKTAISAVRRRVCRHHWKPHGARKVEGATLGWGLRPTRQFGWHHRCVKCGNVRYWGGQIVAADRILNPELYAPDGWPLDEAGNRLPIAD